MMTTTTNPKDNNNVPIFEGPENVRATLSAPTWASVGTPATANGVITDTARGEPLSWGSTNNFANQPFDEGNNGPVDKKIYVELTGGLCRPR